MKPKGTLVMPGEMSFGQMPAVVVFWTDIHAQDKQTHFKCWFIPLHGCEETCRAVRARMTEQIVPTQSREDHEDLRGQLR